jgi:hypothetical protein
MQERTSRNEDSARGSTLASPRATSDDVAPLGPLEAVACFATGLALVLHILVDLPLWLATASTLSAGAVVMVLAVRRHPEGVPAGRRVLGVGFRSAVLATTVYDLTRLGIATGLDFEVGPFDAFKHFGAGLLGTEGLPPGPREWVAGTLFHLTNGTLFGVAYTILAGRKGLVWGVAFGLGLEAVMLGLYPAWLRIPNLQEFTSMSVLGHIAYGAALGVLARRGLERAEAGR